MANSNNVFANAQPLQGNVSDWVAGQEQNDFRYRAEQREVARIEQEKKDKDQLDYEKRLEKFKAPQIDATKVRSIDEINTLVLLKAKDEYLKITKELKPGISNEKYAELIMRQKNLDNLPSYLKLSQEAFVNEATNIQKQLAEGKIKFTPDLQKKLNSFSQGYFDVEFDENLMPMVGLWDKDGDGKPDIMPYDRIVSQQIFGEQIPEINFATEFQKIGEKLGSVENQTDINFKKTTTKQTPIEFAKLTARGSLYDDKGGLTPIAKSKLYDMGYTDFKNVPQKALDQLVNDAVYIMLSTRDKSTKVDVDNSARNTANENARNAKKEDKDKATWGVVETPPIYKSSNIPLAKGYKTIAIQGKVTIPALGFKSDKGNQVITNGQLQSYSIRKNSLGQRQVVAEIVYEYEKGTSSKEVREVDNEYRESFATTTTGKKNKVKVVTLTEKDAKIFAIQLGFKDVNAMKDAARSGKENTTTTTEEFDWSIQ
jgi:hypothetical protein